MIQRLRAQKRMGKRDYYETLGVKKNASAEQLKKVFHGGRGGGELCKW